MASKADREANVKVGLEMALKRLRQVEEQHPAWFNKSGDLQDALDSVEWALYVLDNEDAK